MTSELERDALNEVVDHLPAAQAGTRLLRAERLLLAGDHQLVHCLNLAVDTVNYHRRLPAIAGQQLAVPHRRVALLVAC